MEWSLRSCIEILRQNKKIITIKKSISSDLQLAEYIKNSNNSNMLFKHIRGSKLEVVSGLCGDIESLAILAKKSVIEFKESINLLTSAVVNAHIVSEAPCQEEQININEDFDLQSFFPIPKFSFHDIGKYITAGLVFIKNTTDSNGNEYSQNMAIRRLLFIKQNLFAIRIESKSVLLQIEQARRNNLNVPIAIAIGVHPFLLIASQLKSQFGDANKLGFAGRLLEKPVPMIKATTLNLLVPAEAEIILEGHILPHHLVPEGPVGELSGYYGEQEYRVVVQISRITTKRNPLFQVIAPGTSEQLLSNKLIREANLLRYLHGKNLPVEDLNFSFGGLCRFHVIIKIQKEHDDDAYKIMQQCFEFLEDLKHIVVVDGDIDISNLEKVEWALATRFQANKDVYMFASNAGSTLDPSRCGSSSSACMGLDATIPVAHKSYFNMAK